MQFHAGNSSSSREKSKHDTDCTDFTDYMDASGDPAGAALAIFRSLSKMRRLTCALGAILVAAGKIKTRHGSHGFYGLHGCLRGSGRGCFGYFSFVVEDETPDLCLRTEVKKQSYFELRRS